MQFPLLIVALCTLVSNVCLGEPEGLPSIVLPRSWPSGRDLLVARRKERASHHAAAATDHHLRASASTRREAEVDVEDHAKETVNKTVHHAEHTAKSLSNAPEVLPREAQQDTRLFRRSFLPGFGPKTWVLLCSLGFAIFGIFGVALYVCCIYENDRVEHLDRWAKHNVYSDDLDQDDDLLFGMLHKDKFASHELMPDICIVFHHPTHEKNSDAIDQELSDLNTLQHVLVERGGDYHKLKEFRSFAGLAHDGITARNEQKKLTVRLAREVLLKDLYNFIPHSGFEEKIFRSIDHDELFVCISLNQPKVVDHYLRISKTKLQVQQGVVPALGISHPPDDPHSSPPHIIYDPGVVSALADLQVIERNDPRDLYVCDHASKDKQGTVMNGQDRIKVIYNEVSKYVDLDAAKHQGLIVDWFPVHSYNWLHKLGASWSCFRHLSDMSFVQPVALLKTYFGSRVAFFFAWNGLYCKMFLPLTAAALVLIMLNQVELVFGGPETFAIDHSTFHVFRQALSLGFTVILITWARITANLWKVEETFFMKLWNLNTETATPFTRPEFVGFLKPSDADRNLQVLGQNEKKYQLRCVAATALCFVLCCCVAVVIFLWMTIFEGKLNVFASIGLSLQILLLQFIFNRVAKNLTEWENHQFQTVFYESYLRKVVGLQFVNNYTAFFYLAVRQRGEPSGCGEISCIEAVRRQLAVSLLILSAARIAQVILAVAKVRYYLWKETEDLRKELQALNPNDEPPTRSFAEEQAKYAEFRTQDQIEAYATLMVSLGFVLIFGAVCPIGIPFCAAVFVVQLRASAFALTTTIKRTVPNIMFGIGAWREVVSFLMHVGVFFAGFLVVEYGDYFQGAPLITKVTGFMIFSIAMFCIWAIVDFCFQNGNRKAEILEERRRRVEQRITEATLDEIVVPGSHSGRPDYLKRSSKFEELVKEVTPHDAVAMAVHHGDWEVIPRLDQFQCVEQLEKLQESTKRRGAA